MKKNATVTLDGDTNKSLQQIAKSLNSQVHRVYNGKIIPSVGKHYIAMIPQFMNSAVCALCTAWDFLEQNTFSSNFRIIVVTSEDMRTYEAVKTAISDSRDNEIFRDDQIKLMNYQDFYNMNTDKPKKVKKGDMDNANDTKPVIMIVGRTEDVELSTQMFNPDLIMVDEIVTEGKIKISTKKNYKFLNSLCQDTVMRNIAVVSFTKHTINEQIVDKYNLKNTQIAHKCKSIAETLDSKDIVIDTRLIKFDVNGSYNTQIMSTLNRVLAKRHKRMRDNFSDDMLMKPSIKKIVLITDSSESANNVLTHYKDRRMDYHWLMDVRPYDGSDIDETILFSDLYVQKNKGVFLNKCVQRKILKDTILNRTDNGILIISSEQFIQSVNTHGIGKFKNVDCVMMMDESLKLNQRIYDLMMMMLAGNEIYNTSGNQNCVELTMIETLEKNPHKQLFRLGSILYSHNKTNVEIFETIRRNISTGTIQMDVEFNATRQDKLSRTYKITLEDMRFYNRNNTFYIVPIPKPKSSQIHQQYLIEKDYFKIDVDREKLKEQMQMIKKAKSKEYFGPKWLGTSDKHELPGNKLGFLNEKTGVIEICEIVDTHKFGRRDKRAEWKEKENRDKNILFLSPIIKKTKLTKFRKDVGIKKYEPIKYMQPFVIESAENHQ